MGEGLGGRLMAKALDDIGAVVGFVALGVATLGVGSALAAGFSLSAALSTAAATTIAGIGVSAGTLFAASIGLSFAGSLLAPKPRAPEVSVATADRLQVSINLRTPRLMVFGSTAMGTDLRDQEISGDQAWVHRFILCASHRVHAIREVWLDGTLAWTVTGGVQGGFAGFLQITPVLEGSAANAINIGTRMGSSRRYTGCAYVYAAFKITKNGNTDSPFAASITSRMTIVGDGALFYDPRLDSTVPGGSGPKRADDQSTWSWDVNAARNPALCLLWYLLGWRVQNPSSGQWLLMVGKGVPPERIDLESFITAANLCDEPVAKSGGGTEPRYRCDGVFSEGDDLQLVTENLKATMNALLDDVGGKLRLVVLHNDLGAPIGSLTTADVLGEFSWLQTPPLQDTINVIRGGYTDPSAASLYQLVDYPQVAVSSPDGIERAQTINLPLVQSPSQAQRLAKQRLQRSLYPGMFTAVFQATAWKFQKGDVVRFTFLPLGWSEKLFRIADLTIQVDGTVPMVLREEHADVYAWDASDAPAVQAAAPTVYDASLWPITRAIAALEGDLAALGAESYTFYLTNDTIQLPAAHDGTVSSYALAQGDFVIEQPAGTDVSGDFVLSVVANPQGLTFAGSGMHYAWTGGFDPGEDGAAVTLRAVGTGAHAGISFDQVVTLTKSRAAQDGVSPPLVQVAAEPRTFRIDAAGAIAVQTTTIRVTRQNTDTDPLFTVVDRNGTVVLGPNASAAAIGATVHFDSSDALTLTMLSAQFANWIAGFPERETFSVRVECGGATDSVTVFASRDGATGAAATPFPLATSGAIVVDGAKATKTGASGWDASVRSTVGYTGDVAASARISGPAPIAMIALNTDPTTNDSYDTLDFAMQRHGDLNTWTVVEGSSISATVATSTSDSDVPLIRREGTKIRYYLNGALVYTHAGDVDPTAPLYFDSSLYRTGTKLEAMLFGATGAPGASAPLLKTQWSIDGATSWHDSFFGADRYYRQSNDNGANWGPAVLGVGEAGTNGEYSSTVYKWSATVPAAPPNGTGDPPAGWTDDPGSTGTGYLFQAKARFRRDGATLTQLTNWGKPVRISGTPGTSPYALALTTNTLTIEASYAGVTKSGQLPRTVGVQLVQGTTDVLAAAVITATPSSGAIAASYAGGAISVSQADAPGYIDVAATIGGSAVASARIEVKRPLDAPPPQSQSSASQDVLQDIASSASYVGAHVSVTLRANGSGQLIAQGGCNYTVASPGTGVWSWRAGASFAYRSAGGGAWSYTSEVVGLTAQSVAESDPVAGSVSITPTTISGLSAGALYEVGLAVRKSFGSTPDGIGVTLDGGFSVTQ